MRPSMICPQRTAEGEDDTTTTTVAEEMGKIDLQDSVLTTPTDTGSVSEGDDNSSGGGGGGVGYWLLGGISSDIRTLAKSLKETAGGVADFVSRSATAVALEFQVNYGSDDEQDELDAAGRHERREKLRLPWEIRHHHDHQEVDQNSNHGGEEIENQEGAKSVGVKYEEDLILKEKIHALSAKEDTFLKPFTAEMQVATEERFLDKPRIELVNRILQVDEQLRATHARLSGRSNVQETVFWRNYFYHCSETRKIHLDMYQQQEVRDDESENSSSLVPANDSDDDDDDDGNNHVQGSTADDSSFIHVPSPPGSTGILSVDSMIFVDEME